MNKNKLILFISVFALSGCNQKPKCENSAEKICIENPKVAAGVQDVFDRMIYVEPGEFRMGLAKGPLGERPIRDVYLDGYYLHQSATLYSQLDVFDEFSGWERAKPDAVFMRYPERAHIHYGPGFPVDIITPWRDAYSYCAWLGEVTGLPFSLPSEAQFEKAGKAGRPHALYGTDDGTAKPGINISHSGDRRTEGYRTFVHQYDKYPPNPWGFYGMSDNGEEWMIDKYDQGWLQRSPTRNPVNAPTEDEILAELSQRRSNTLFSTRSDWTSIYIQKRRGARAANSNSFRCAINTEGPLPSITVPE